jgi:hypothetical protein
MVQDACLYYTTRLGVMYITIDIENIHIITICPIVQSRILRPWCRQYPHIYYERKNVRATLTTSLETMLIFV